MDQLNDRLPGYLLPTLSTSSNPLRKRIENPHLQSVYRPPVRDLAVNTSHQICRYPVNIVVVVDKHSVRIGEINVLQRELL